MARKKKHHEEELPFVALMDTMTNVVGVLIIVLVLIGIGLAKSVRKVLSDLPPVTVEEHAKLVKEVEESAVKVDLKQVAEETAKLREMLKKTTEELAAAEKTKEKQNIQVFDFDSLEKQISERKKERDAKKLATEGWIAEIDKLKARLDATPVYQAPPATVVRLPNPRAMPEKAEINRFLVMGGRVYYVNQEELLRIAEQEIRAKEQSLTAVRELVKGPDGRPQMQKDKFGRTVPVRRVVYDAQKVADYFEDRPFGDRDWKIEIGVPNSSRIPVRFVPKPNGGEAPEQFKSSASGFQTRLRQWKNDSKSVVWFHVFKDSIETYLAARDFADEIGVPVGWEMYGGNVWNQALTPELVINFIPPPPQPPQPPQPPPPPGTPPPIRIAPPKATLFCVLI
jgi:hypothetical protein